SARRNQPIARAACEDGFAKQCARAGSLRRRSDDRCRRRDLQQRRAVGRSRYSPQPPALNALRCANAEGATAAAPSITWYQSATDERRSILRAGLAHLDRVVDRGNAFGGLRNFGGLRRVVLGLRRTGQLDDAV